MTALMSFTLLAMLPFLRSKALKCLPWSDGSLGLIGLVSNVVAFIAMCFGGFYPSLSPWFFCLIYAPSAYVFASLRSAFSKIAKPDERGKIFAIAGLFNNVVSLVVSIIFNYFYGFLVTSATGLSSTAIFVHGYIFLVASGLQAIALVLTIWLAKQNIPGWSLFK